MKIGIIISTYQRKDNKTISYLKRTLECIKNQTYSDWKIYIVGDYYDNHLEFSSICRSIHPEKIIAVNSHIAKEREKYTGEILWNTGGVNSLNIALTLAIGDGVDVVAHIDDDDVWLPNHLEKIIEGYSLAPNVSFVYTKGEYINNHILPFDNVPLGLNNLRPRHANILHSSISWKVENLRNVRYLNPFEQNPPYNSPADWDMSRRLIEQIETLGLSYVHVPCVTIKHTEERGVLG
jgi:glycosyltransferase involved in cell wall biosynthesis